MKNVPLLFLLLSLFITACGDDDDASPSCDTTDVAAVIVGDWTETPILGVGDEVSFNSDMTGSCTSNSLFTTEVNGDVSNTFTWTLSTDNSTITLAYPNSLTVDYNVDVIECDAVNLELFGFTVMLNRK